MIIIYNDKSWTMNKPVIHNSSLIILKSHYQRQKPIRHHQAAGKKADDGKQGRKLQVGQTADGVPRGAAARVARAKTDQKTAQPQKDHPS